MPYTEADLERVRAARLSGLKAMEFRSPNGSFRREEFSSGEDYDRLEQQILSDIAAASQTHRPKRVFMAGGSGW